MANSSISGLSRNPAGSTTQTAGSISSGSTAAKTLQVRSTAAASGAGRRSAAPAVPVSRQSVNADGENYNRNARRGTYLNILV